MVAEPTSLSEAAQRILALEDELTKVQLTVASLQADLTKAKDRLNARYILSRNYTIPTKSYIDKPLIESRAIERQPVLNDNRAEWKAWIETLVVAQNYERATRLAPVCLTTKDPKWWTWCGLPNKLSSM